MVVEKKKVAVMMVTPVLPVAAVAAAVTVAATMEEGTAMTMTDSTESHT